MQTFRPVFIERLESRIAPAKIVDASHVTYRDIDGDLVTISSTAAIFDSSNVNDVLKFSTGTVDGSTATKQALWEIDLDVFTGRTTVGGSMLSIAADGSTKRANVGFIKSETHDLDSVFVDGDLARIRVGDSDTSTRGLNSLEVYSMGLQGLKTQAAGGDLISVFHGGLDTLETTKGISNATLVALGNDTEIDGNLDGAFGTITIAGSLAGNSTPYGGSIFATGTIGSVEIKGSLVGGSADFTGYIGAAPGSIQGLPDLFSSGDHVGSVKIGIDVRGGTGKDSGTVQATSIDLISVGGTVHGNKGERSGFLYSTAAMGTVEIGEDLLGGAGRGSGRVENNDGELQKVFIGGQVKGGAGEESGTVYSDSGLGMVFIESHLTGGAGELAVDVAIGDVRGIDDFGGGDAAFEPLDEDGAERLHGA